jgi:outer membrane protein OmpA-like peptidoglycan-associated protein
MYDCPLQRVEATDLAMPVLVNNEPTELPVLHARCALDNNDDNDYYVLDQLSNPIFLYTRLGKYGDSSQTIKITFETANKTNSLEQKLADKQPVEIYGIYFDFNSAHIKPESEAVLKQISDVMHKNPTWKLSVSGHTDNIGDADFNQKLSQARAEAVKTALVKEYKIAPDRLTTSGYGASRPVADNKKPEGRALNRRVELQRQ